MSESASHAVWTLHIYHPSGWWPSGWHRIHGLIRHVIQILTCNIQYLSYIYIYIYIYYVLSFTRNTCNIANVCTNHQSINQSIIYEYLLLTLKLTYFLFVRFMQMAAGFKNVPQEDDSFQKEVYAHLKCATI